MSDAKFTPGPWVWTYNRIGGSELITPDRGKLYVMDFGRQGMQGATPRFSYWEGLERGRQGGIMMDASHYLTENGGIDHPDAHLIAAAPDLYEALCRCRFDSLNMEIADLKFIHAAMAKARGES